MRSFLRRNAALIGVAAFSLTVGLTGPAFSHGVQHALFAHNADKVDGKHAVGAGATINSRKGKLVATSSTTGRLPDNIVSSKVAFPKVVPAGVTVVGRWGFDGQGDDGQGDWGASIGYPVPMPATLTTQVVPFGGPSTATCPGTAAAPATTPGRLCIYVAQRSGFVDAGSAFGSSRFGTTVLFADDGTGSDIYAYGTWAAKPPSATARTAPRVTDTRK